MPSVPTTWPGGLFGVLFAITSALHSYLIVSYASEDGVSLDVGFYNMANAMGRLLGTVLSGWVFKSWGLVECLIISSVMIITSAVIAHFFIEAPEFIREDKCRIQSVQGFTESRKVEVRWQRRKRFEL